MTGSVGVPSVDVAAIQSRCEAATPGPWESDGEYDRAEVCQVDGDWATVVGTEEVGHGHLRHDRLILRAADSQFIAHARTDVPVLVAALVAAESRAQVAEAAVERVEAVELPLSADALHEPWREGFEAAMDLVVAALRGDAT